MTIEKAIEHLTRKIKGSNYSTDYDKACIDRVAEFVNNVHDGFDDRRLFFKLYLYLYAEFIKYYREASFDKIPQKELHKILDRSTPSLIDDLVNAINMAEYYEMEASGEGYEPKTWEPEQIQAGVIAQAIKALEKFGQ